MPDRMGKTTLTQPQQSKANIKETTLEIRNRLSGIYVWVCVVCVVCAMHTSLRYIQTKQTNWKENEDRNIRFVKTKIKWEFNVIMINVSVYTLLQDEKIEKKELQKYAPTIRAIQTYEIYNTLCGLSNQLDIDLNKMEKIRLIRFKWKRERERFG